jgi:hypothetical protein
MKLYIFMFAAMALAEDFLEDEARGYKNKNKNDLGTGN